MSDAGYELGSKITFFIVFVASWIYCIASYGYLLGVGLGWLPSLIVACIVAFLWPLLAIVLILAAAIFAWFALKH